MAYRKLPGMETNIAEQSANYKEKALNFIRNNCQDLRYNKEKEAQEQKGNILLGTSLKANQIPYNMQMDIDRLCLERALARFFESGRKEDAFDVYFCYLEMFVGDYEKTRRMIELLSEYEANGSELLMKHRDHYSHSVYVFALGLALYASSSAYRNAYKTYYADCKFANDYEAACHFLEYWGMSSLFHDIGYPFELPFEQVSAYFEVENEDRSKRPYVAYKGLDSFRNLDKSMQRKLGVVLGLDENESLKTTDELFSYYLYKRMGRTYYFSEEEMLGFLTNKPTSPNQFGFFMDHAYFSATVLFRKLFCEMECDLRIEHMDALTAILLHNSLYKFCVAYYKNPSCNIPLDMNLHPLAYMLMLCDELQCWDRTAYGRNSKHEFHPMEADFDLSEDNQIKVAYKYDPEGGEKIERFVEKYDKWSADHRGDKPKLKAYSSMYIKEKIRRPDDTEEKVTEFQADIERIVNLSVLKLNVTADVLKESPSKRRGYLSDSNFISLYNFGAALNARWSGEDKSEKEIYENFKGLSLEYKLSNINQAKSFAKYLNEIGAFYTNRVVDFDMLNEFTKDELALIGPMEHERWVREHCEMGWGYISMTEINELVEKEYEITDGRSREFKVARTDLRERLRRHWDMIPDMKCGDEQPSDHDIQLNYNRLGLEEQDKDTKPMECMIALLKKFDGLRIYRLK